MSRARTPAALSGPRLLLASVSLALASLLAWWLLRAREPETIELVDSSEAVARLLTERHALGELPPDDASALLREPLDLELVRVFHPAVGRSGWVYHPDCYFRLQPGYRGHVRFREHPAGGFDVYGNDEGMYEVEDVRRDTPDLRVLVTGDSHTAGLCAPAESFTNLLEVSLASTSCSVDALNAAAGSYQPYNYLGVLEAYTSLGPDVFVAVVYGGNDFYGLMGLQRYFHRRPPPRSVSSRVDRLLRRQRRGLIGQELQQVLYFLANPEDEAIAVATLNAITAEMARQCSSDGIALLCVYLPPPSRGQPERHEQTFREALLSIDADPGALELSDRLADRWLAFLVEQQIAHLDLRPTFRAADAALYWKSDYHLNLAGHRAVAAALAPTVRALTE